MGSLPGCRGCLFFVRNDLSGALRAWTSGPRMGITWSMRPGKMRMPCSPQAAITISARFTMSLSRSSLNGPTGAGWLFRSFGSVARYAKRLPTSRLPYPHDLLERMQHVMVESSLTASAVEGFSITHRAVGSCSSQQRISITTTVQGGTCGEARRAARRLAWECLARSLHSCVSSSHRSSSAGPNRSRGSISRTTR